MVTIIPAILQLSRSNLEQEIKRLGVLSPFLHIDITGELVDAPSVGFSPADLRDILEEDTMGVQFQAHLMLSKQELDLWLPPLLGIDLVSAVIIHHEVKDGALLLMDSIRTANKSAVLAVNPNTPVEVVDGYKGMIDGMMVMGVVPGAQGKLFDPSTFDRVRALKKNYPNLTIMVDGGVNLEDQRALKLAQAGAETLIVGSKIRDAHDPQAVYDAFVAAVNQVN